MDTMNSKLTLIVCALGSMSAHAATGFIEDSARTDVAYDSARQILYISGGDSVRRYDMLRKKFLTPLTLGGSTLGLDISPDGRTLAVANGSRAAKANFVDLVNLATLKSQRISFPLEYGEGGTYSVAWDLYGDLLVSSKYEGSGWVPLRKLSARDGTVTKLGSINQDSMLAASADKKSIAIAEANISNGAWGVYHAGDTSYKSDYSLNSSNFEIGISADGSQVAIPSYMGTRIDDANKVFPSVGEYGGVVPIAAAYSALENKVYFPMTKTNYIAVYSAYSMKELKRYTVPGTYDWNGGHGYIEGRTKVANDNSFLFSTLDKGIYYTTIRKPAQ